MIEELRKKFKIMSSTERANLISELVLFAVILISLFVVYEYSTPPPSKDCVVIIYDQQKELAYKITTNTVSKQAGEISFTDSKGHKISSTSYVEIVIDSGEDIKNLLEQYGAELAQ